MITESRVSYNGVSTRVLSVAGAGVPIVLLHGFADSADTWRGVLEHLEAAGQAALAVDLPGFGSADPLHPGPMLPQFDAFANALIAELGPVVFVGNSLGSATSVRAAGRHPRDRVQAVVAVDDPISCRHWPARWVRWGQHRVLLRAVARTPIPAPVLAWAVRIGVRRVLYGPGYTADPAVLRYWTALVPNTAAVAALGRAAFQYARETAGGHGELKITCPALVVHGGKDRIIPVHSSRAVHELIPGSEFVVLSRAGHCPHLDDPAEVTRLLLDFLVRAGIRIEKAS